jgi:hypothetical protein
MIYEWLAIRLYILQVLVEVLEVAGSTRQRERERERGWGVRREGQSDQRCYSPEIDESNRISRGIASN